MSKTDNKPWIVLLRQVRKRLGESQVQFASRFGVATNTVSRWETGAYDIPAEVVWWLCQQEQIVPTVCQNCRGTGVIYPPRKESRNA